MDVMEKLLRSSANRKELVSTATSALNFTRLDLVWRWLDKWALKWNHLGAGRRLLLSTSAGAPRIAMNSTPVPMMRRIDPMISR